MIMNVLTDQRNAPVQETSSCNERKVMVVVDLRRVHYRLTDRESIPIDLFVIRGKEFNYL